MSAAAGDERSRLVRALALSRRFHLYLARCASPRAADQLIDALAEELPRLRRGEVTLVRLDPYAGRPTIAPLTDAELTDGVLLPLLSPPDDLSAHGVIHVVDATRAPHVDSDAWARFFSLWNEKRNVMQSHGGEVLVLLPEALAPVFATAAPDVWSIRSGEYRIEREAEAPPRGAVAGGSPAEALPRVDIARSFRAIPSLALFGGDLLVWPWVEHITFDREARALLFDAPTTESDEPGVGARRIRRMTDEVLAWRRFGEAEGLFRELLDRVGDRALIGDAPEIEAIALSGLCIALAAQDRASEAVEHGERALALIDGGPEPSALDMDLKLWLKVRVLGSNALVRWCVGHLQRAEGLDDAITRHVGCAVEDEVSGMLRWVERGRVVTAIEGVHSPDWSSSRDRTSPFPPSLDADHRVVSADLRFLMGQGEMAHEILDDMRPQDFWMRSRLLGRCGALTALVEAARGDTARAAHLLSVVPAVYPARQSWEGDAVFRDRAMHAYASAMLAVETSDAEGARTWLGRAQGFIDEWGRTGLDRRSRLRARVTVDLGLVMLEPSIDKALSMARELAGRAVALLGDTAEDHVSRVLAVQAHLELARRLTPGAEKDAAARRAADLARPLGGLGVPAWDALLQAAGASAPA